MKTLAGVNLQLWDTSALAPNPLSLAELLTVQVAAWDGCLPTMAFNDCQDQQAEEQDTRCHGHLKRSGCGGEVFEDVLLCQQAWLLGLLTGEVCLGGDVCPACFWQEYVGCLPLCLGHFERI